MASKWGKDHKEGVALNNQIETNYGFSGGIAASLFNPLKKSEDNKKKQKVGKSRFDKMLEKETENLYEASSVANDNESLQQDEHVIALQDAVYSAGDALKKRVNSDTILEYKKAVKQFLAYIVANAFDFKKASSRPSFTFKGAKSSAIRLIDEKLERFATELFTNQLSQLMILERLEEIKGLIIDLLQ